MHLSFEINDFQLLDILLEVRASFGKLTEFRLKYNNVSETEYAWLVQNKVALYRDYLDRENINIKICTLVLKDLFSSLSIIGQHAIKDTFCKNNGLVILMNIVKKTSWSTSENLTTRTVLWCFVIGTL